MNVYVVIGLAVGITVIIFVIVYGNKKNKVHEDSITSIVNRIKPYQPKFLPEHLKTEVRTAADGIVNPKTADDYFLKG